MDNLTTLLPGILFLITAILTVVMVIKEVRSIYPDSLFIVLFSFFGILLLWLSAMFLLKSFSLC